MSEKKDIVVDAKAETVKNEKLGTKIIGQVVKFTAPLL